MKKSERLRRMQFESSDELTADAIYRLGEMSYRMEESRYESLLSSSSHILNCISIAAIALATLLAPVLSAVADFASIVGMAYLTTYAILLTSFVVALIAQYRFKYSELRGPAHLAAHTKDQASEFKSSTLAAKYFCECIEESYQSIRERNKKISRLVKIATILLMVAIGVIVLWTAFICGVAFAGQQ